MAQKQIYQELSIHGPSYCSSRRNIIERELTWTHVLRGYYDRRRHHESKHKKTVTRKIVQDYTEGETEEYRDGKIALPQLFWKLYTAGVS